MGTSTAQTRLDSGLKVCSHLLQRTRRNLLRVLVCGHVLHQFIQCAVPDETSAIRMKPPDELTVAFTVDGDGPAIFLEPARAEDVPCGVGYEGSDFGALELPHRRLC